MGKHFLDIEYPIPIDVMHFEDYDFRQWLLNQPYGRSGFLTEEDISNVTKIEIHSLHLDSLVGIEYFTELEELDCSYCDLNRIDLSHNKKLKKLICDVNVEVKGY